MTFDFLMTKRSLSLQEFVTEGTLDGIGLGASLNDVGKFFGEPSTIKHRTRSMKKRGEHKMGLW